MKELQGKKILFIFGHGGMEAHALKLSRELEGRWKTTSFFLGGSKGGEQYLIGEGIPPENITSTIFDDAKTDFPSPDMEYIKKAEQKYGFSSWDIWQISATRKKSRMQLPPDSVLYWIEHYLRENESCFKKFKPDYMVFYGIASFSGVILYQMALQHKIKVIEITNSRIPGRFAINNNLQARWPLLVKEYQSLKKRDLTKEEAARAEEYLTKFKDKPFKPDGTAGLPTPWAEKIKKYQAYAQIFAYRRQIPDLKQFFWPLANKLLDLSGTFEQPVAGEKFVYFPLHFNPEVSTSFYGKWYVNQLALIETIMRSLPCDYKLYVKEHPHNYSSRPRYFRQELKKLANVRLISPHANSIQLIKDCSLVLTITGTVGWEALLLQKPVIAFGDVFYTIFDEVTKIEDIKLLPSLIQKKVGTEMDKAKTLKIVTAVFNSTFPGSGATPGDSGKVTEKENISLLVDGIEEYLHQP